MKMNSPLKPHQPDFAPLFCAAHHKPAQKTQFVVQINPPFQFVGLLTIHQRHDASYPAIGVHIYPKTGWPKGLNNIVDSMKVALVEQLSRLFLDIPDTATVEAIDTGKTICDLDPYMEYLYCETENAGLETDCLVYIRRPWCMFMIDNQDQLTLSYTEHPHYIGNVPTQPAPDPTYPEPTDPKAYLEMFTKQLERISADDIPEEL